MNTSKPKEDSRANDWRQSRQAEDENHKKKNKEDEEFQQDPTSTDELAALGQLQKPGRIRSHQSGRFEAKKTPSDKAQIRQTTIAELKGGTRHLAKSNLPDLDDPQPASHEQDTDEAEAPQKRQRTERAADNTNPIIKPNAAKPPSSQRLTSSVSDIPRAPSSTYLNPHIQNPYNNASSASPAFAFHEVESRPQQASNTASTEPRVLSEGVDDGDRSDGRPQMVRQAIEKLLQTGEIGPRPKRPNDEPLITVEVSTIRGNVMGWDPTTGTADEEHMRDACQ